MDLSNSVVFVFAFVRAENVHETIGRYQTSISITERTNPGDAGREH
jgi:hypothetical protein